MAVGIGRRQFISALGSAVLAWPLTAHAQQPAVGRRIAILSDFSELEMQPLIATFREQLQQLGWGDDSIRIDTRLGITGAAQFQGAAAALIGMAPDVILTLGSPSLRAMKQETHTIPIVFTFVADPVVARPCREPCPSWRQRHGVHQFRVLVRREMAGCSQRDRASHFKCHGDR